MFHRALIVTLAILVVGCTGGPTPPETGEQLARLQPVADCDSLLSHLKQQAIAQMEERLDEMLGLYMSGGYCGGWGYDGYAEADGFDSSNRAPGPATAGAGEHEGASEYSETNNQVAGVDEADFIKNDGAHVYMVANQRFKIIDAWPPEQAHVVASVALEGEPKKLFVVADKALIYSSLDPVQSGDSYYGPWGYYGGYYGSGECTYGYDCDFAGDGRQLKITVLDISNRAAPVVERELWLSGSYLNARRIGTAVHTAVLFPPVSFPGITYYPEILDECWSSNPPTRWQLYHAFQQLKWENRQVILQADIGDWLPSIVDSRRVGDHFEQSNTLLESCESYYRSGDSDGQSFLSLLSLDMTELTPAQVTTVVGKPGAVYASSDALYVSARHDYRSGYGWYYDNDGDAPTEASTVHKFDLVNEPPGCSYAGSGVVKGRVLNQFSMDEHEGFLRIATTTGRVPSPDVHSTMSVLEQQGDSLRVVGVVDDIAPTEDIRSVRFNGKTAFIVTFKKTDPLFTFDLSDPTDPRIVAELKIPGFSTYMHLLDDGHLLTIGYDAEDHDSFAYFQGLMLQIFDVTDLTDPQLIHKEVIGTRGSTSDAATNHLAFNYFAPREMLAIPITVCEDSGGGGSYGDTMSFSGLLLYDVSIAGGFSRRGGVAHVDPAEVENHSSFCSNWWTNSNSIVKRSIFMDDYIYSVALDRIKIQQLDTLGEDVRNVNLVCTNCRTKN